MHVLTIWARPSGLLIAQGLKKYNIPFTIFDKAKAERGREWAVTLHWAMQTVRSLLPEHLAGRLLVAQTNLWEGVSSEKEEVFIRKWFDGRETFFDTTPKNA